ncbi:MAG: putative toxin-antitoxin system toxin component, PIN family [Acidobacteria bacterium]|nr:putative toxin-antitoxin system toxin component, PIN family [Acidobacteriota bacterium]
MRVAVVLDTNVIVSAHLNPDGLEAAVFLLALAGKIQALLSEPVFAEYKEVLLRPKFGLSAAQVEKTLKTLWASGRIVKPTQSLSVARDPADNKFLECAEAGQASYLVSGNKRHFPKTWGKTKVVNARELIKFITPDLER